MVSSRICSFCLSPSSSKEVITPVVSIMCAIRASSKRECGGDRVSVLGPEPDVRRRLLNSGDSEGGIGGGDARDVSKGFASLFANGMGCWVGDNSNAATGDVGGTGAVCSSPVWVGVDEVDISVIQASSTYKRASSCN